MALLTLIVLVFFFLPAEIDTPCQYNLENLDENFIVVPALYFVDQLHVC